MKRSVWIIGAGLAGSITARLCRSAGHEVMVIDSAKPFSGTQAAACLMSPKWLSSLNGYQQAMAYATLRKIAPMKQIDFGRLKLDWVDPAHLLVKPDIGENVLTIRAGDTVVTATQDIVVKSSVVLVAAGIYCQELVPTMPDIRPVMGTALLFKGVTKPQFNMWAPFKQAIAFNISPDRIWFGNDSAVLYDNFTPHHIESTVHRAAKYMKLTKPVRTIVGARPKMEGYKNGYLESHGKDLWVMTGGYKNGTALYALMAKRFLEEISA